MPNLQRERDHLAQADRDIAEGKMRVAEQITLIDQMTARGQETTLARDFLRNLEQTLEQWHVHRQLILNEIARLEAQGS